MLIKAQFKVKLFYDIVSPYSWLAFESLLRYKKHWSKAEIELIPCSIKHVFEKSGNTAPLFNPLKASYIVKDAQRAGEIYKLPLIFPSNFKELAVKKGTLGAMQFVTAIDSLSEGQMTEIISRNLWKAIFCNNPGKDISDPNVWLEVGKLGAIDESLLTKAIEHSKTNEIQSQVIFNSKLIVQHGGFGLPSIILETPETSHLLFGSDRIELLAYLLGEKYLGPCPPL